MSSIRRKLLGGLICGFAVASAISAFGIFHTARKEASELFDYELRTVALSMPANLEAARNVEQPDPEYEGIADDLILIEIWDDAGHLVYHSRMTPTLPRYVSGIRTVEHEENRWRVYGTQQAGRYVQVAQPVSVRDGLALRLALHTLWPFALFVPAAIALVLLVAARGLAPVSALSTALATRSLNSLEPLRIDNTTPVELRPLVEALNDLLQRLRIASQTQRNFIADAAHELRSPLAALKLQLQAALRDGTLSGEAHTLERVSMRLNRLIRLAQQLLTLAREDAGPERDAARVSLRKLAEHAVGDFSLLAEEKGIDLGLEHRAPVSPDDPCEVLADAHGLATLLGNLIDNAVRYTPQGGKVDLVLTRSGDRLGFQVVDNGPGIPADELERVLDRFYRSSHVPGTGSGLGLSIAWRIAERQALTLTLQNNADGHGLTVAVEGLSAAGA
ncbi:ATP-binding protein [Paraburkholderia sp. B3]|uniref:ATP-binding protein n=1 Tax=Paraburkholderia sp. B3 TaxID=3134791 RepID=UPI0039821E8C